MLGLLLETEVEDEEETEVLFTEAANASPYLYTYRYCLQGGAHNPSQFGVVRAPLLLWCVVCGAR